MVISSRDNDIVRRMRRLQSDGKLRRKEGAFVIEGARLCEDAARSGVTFETALITARAREKYAAQVAAVEGASTHVFEVTDAVAELLSDTENAQGVICLCKALDNRKMLGTIDSNILSTFNSKKWLALEDVRDPGNIGTVIRTAEALGIDGLILSTGCCDVYSPKVLRGSMGGVFRLPLWETADMPHLLAELRNAGVTSFACVPSNEVLSVVNATFTAGTVCVIGNEANGLTESTIAACDHRLTIPMAGRAESLNAAVAASLVMWEMCRREYIG